MDSLTLQTFLFLTGLTLLTLGADWLVRGACRLANDLGINPLVVGLTVVAFGTSAPELFVSAKAALDHNPDMVIGNVMGSTVANVGLIVGLGAMIRPIDVNRRLLVRETPLVIMVLTIVMVLSLNDALGRLDGFALVGGFLIYLLFLFRWGKGPEAKEEAEKETAVHSEDFEAARTTRGAIFQILIGIPSLVVGASWLVDAATEIAAAFHVSDAVIGATAVALGTSLPELASTIAAAVRKMGDIAIGNVIGSNVFNLGLVLGASALLQPLQPSPELVVRLVLPALVFCVLLIPLALTGGRVNRWEGLLLLTGYGAYIWFVQASNPGLQASVAGF